MHEKRTPIIDALRKYQHDGTTRFHMPGHKGGHFIHPTIKELLGNKTFHSDVTNVPGMDDLHQPQGIIKEAERFAAETFGAEYTYFLVNGSSCGLQALVMTVCGAGDKILVPRNIHRSILGGIILSGAMPVFYLPEYNVEYGIPLGTEPRTIRACLERTPGIKAVLVVNPTYQGITSDIKAIADISHEFGIPLLVDEAHGPHLCFHEELPPSSLEQGADAAVHGTHKLLTALTQASMLHLNSSRINRERLESILKLLQSTSTSYILLSSLDAARAQMAESGKELIDRALRLGKQIREHTKNISGLKTFGSEIVGRPGIYGLDLTKVTISFKEWGVSGFWVEEILRKQFHIQVEMADLYNILLLVTFGNTEQHMQKLIYSLGETCSLLDNVRKTHIIRRNRDINVFPALPEAVVSPREAFFAVKKSVPLEQSIGLVSGETVACYPPGIPVICPGEKITVEIIEYLLVMREMGARFQGCFDTSLQSISVLQ